MYANRKMLILICIFIFGELANTVTAYNSMLTYTVRPRKIILQPNITGKIIIDHYNRYNDYINGHISFNFIKSHNIVVIIFYRCDIEGINCEYFQTWKLNNLCHKLKEDNQVWTSVVRSFYPPLECPFQVHYQLKNITVELGPFLRWYPDVTKYQWRLQMDFFSNDLFLGRIIGNMLIFSYRKRIN